VKFWFGDIDTYGKEENEVQVSNVHTFIWRLLLCHLFWDLNAWSRCL
jgi:hypothetical protein